MRIANSQFAMDFAVPTEFEESESDSHWRPA